MIGPLSIGDINHDYGRQDHLGGSCGCAPPFELMTNTVNGQTYWACVGPCPDSENSLRSTTWNDGGITVPYCECRPGLYWSDNAQGCKQVPTCPPIDENGNRYFYDFVLEDCVADCPSGMFYNPITNSCECEIDVEGRHRINVGGECTLPPCTERYSNVCNHANRFFQTRLMAQMWSNWMNSEQFRECYTALIDSGQIQRGSAAADGELIRITDSSLITRLIHTPDEIPLAFDPRHDASTEDVPSPFVSPSAVPFISSAVPAAWLIDFSDIIQSEVDIITDGMTLLAEPMTADEVSLILQCYREACPNADDPVVLSNGRYVTSGGVTTFQLDPNGPCACHIRNICLSSPVDSEDVPYYEDNSGAGTDAGLSNLQSLVGPNWAMSVPALAALASGIAGISSFSQTMPATPGLTTGPVNFTAPHRAPAPPLFQSSRAASQVRTD